MLTLSDCEKSYAGRTLFSEVTLQVNRGDRIGLVGPNGAGKTTLFKLILGQEEPDSGSVTFQRGATVGFLPQETAPAGEETVIELVCSLPASGMGHEDDAEMEFDGSAVAKAKRILKGLAFRETDFDRAVKTLSGGWVMRAHLARLLVQEPDLLMLDEPTNHLDLETLIWFQQYLKSYPGGILLISHDREFLNQLVTHIVELRQGRLWRYRGNYDAYLEQRAAAEEQQLAAYKNQQREIERLMDFVTRFRAKNTKAAQAQSKLKQIDRMEKISAPDAALATVDFNFPQPEKSGQRVITLREVHFAYGDHSVYRGIDFEAERGARVVLVGPNGSGKSTLLKLLAGVLTPTRGERDEGLKVRVGYYSQYRTEMLQSGRTVLAEALDTPARVTELAVRSLLGCFLFRDDDVFKKVDVLSGGEKSRLALVKILLDPPNLLLMDEPTTHLDMSSIDALVAALTEFTGTVIFISHDVHFIRSIASRVVHIDAGRLTSYAGDYAYYLEKTRAISARAALTATSGDVGATSRPTNSRPTETAARTAAGNGAGSQKDRRQQVADVRKLVSAQRRLVADLEAHIAALEVRQDELATELEKPATYETPGRAVEINRELKIVVDEMAEKNRAWEDAAKRLSDLESSELTDHRVAG